LTFRRSGLSVSMAVLDQILLVRRARLRRRAEPSSSGPASPTAVLERRRPRASSIAEIRKEVAIPAM